MSLNSPMISLAEAWARVDDGVTPLHSESCSIEHASGRVLCEDITSPHDVYPFRAATMDGFAVLSDWLRECNPNHPVNLPIGGTLFAGDTQRAIEIDRTSLKIMTGAPVPEFYDAVIPFENTRHDHHTVQFSTPAFPGMNIRPIAEDIRAGQRLFSREDRLKPHQIGLLAAVGLVRVSVHARPRVLVASIGDELVPPGGELPPGRIYDTNSVQVHALVAPFCNDISLSPVLSDNPFSLSPLFERDHDVIITSGGVSAGERDHVVDTAKACGWETLLHRVRIKPGMPLFIACKGNRLLFGLPGNPLSATVTCSLFVVPALKRLLGIRAAFPVLNPCKIAAEYSYTGDRTLVWPGRIRREGSEFVATLSPLKSSSALSVLMDSDGLILVENLSKHSSSETRSFALPWHELL